LVALDAGLTFVNPAAAEWWLESASKYLKAGYLHDLLPWCGCLNGPVPDAYTPGRGQANTFGAEARNKAAAITIRNKTLLDPVFGYDSRLQKKADECARDFS